MKSSKTWLWLGAAALALAGLLPLLMLVRAGYDSGTAPGIVLGVVSVIAIFSALGWSNGSRLRALRQANPGAFVANLVSYQELAMQVGQVASLLSVPTGRVRAMKHVSVVIDRTKFEIYGGAFNPRLEFSAPATTIESARIATRSQGKWNLDCIELDFRGPSDASALLDLCLVHGGVPLAKKGVSLQKALDNLFLVRADLRAEQLPLK